MQTVRADMQELEIELDGPKRVTVIQPATISKASSMYTKLGQIAGGWVISLCGVIAAVAYWDYLAKKVNGEEDVTRTVRVIGTLPSVQRGKFGSGGSIEEAMKVAIDGIRTAILYNRNNKVQCVMVTSGTGQEGRSTVASQLAVSMARAGKTTLLIDADLRNPQQHAIFGVQPHGGLSEMLRGEQTSDQAIVATAVENVWLLSAGRCDQTALQGLSGDQAKTVFQDLRDRFDVIIIDASPVLTSPDALLSGQHADAAILSVRRDVSQMPKVTAALDRLGSVGIPVLGAVVNGPHVELRSSEQAMAQPTAEEEKPALTNA
jgi:capsular exopolysaccharide synthesis family protein